MMKMEMERELPIGMIILRAMDMVVKDG